MLTRFHIPHFDLPSQKKSRIFHRHITPTVLIGKGYMRIQVVLSEGEPFYWFKFFVIINYSLIIIGVYIFSSNVGMMHPMLWSLNQKYWVFCLSLVALTQYLFPCPSECLIILKIKEWVATWVLFSSSYLNNWSLSNVLCAWTWTPSSGEVLRLLWDPKFLPLLFFFYP